MYGTPSLYQEKDLRLHFYILLKRAWTTFLVHTGFTWYKPDSQSSFTRSHLDPGADSPLAGTGTSVLGKILAFGPLLPISRMPFMTTCIGGQGLRAEVVDMQSRASAGNVTWTQCRTSWLLQSSMRLDTGTYRCGCKGISGEEHFTQQKVHFNEFCHGIRLIRP